MAGFAQLHDTGVSNRLSQRHQVREVLIDGIDAAQRPGTGLEPALQRVARLGFSGAGKQNRCAGENECSSRGAGHPVGPFNAFRG